VPAVDVDEFVEEVLDVGDELFVRIGLVSWYRLVGMAGADDVGDAVFMAVDGELVGDGERTALAADVGELLFVAEGDGLLAGGGFAYGVPAGAIGVVVGFVGVDEVVVEFVEGFEKIAVEWGLGGHGWGLWSWRV